MIRKQVNARLEDSIHDTCMKRVYAQLTYTYTGCDVSYMMLRLAPTIHCILTSLKLKPVDNHFCVCTFAKIFRAGAYVVASEHKTPFHDNPNYLTIFEI